jgi:hypothetical protein
VKIGKAQVRLPRIIHGEEYFLQRASVFKQKDRSGKPVQTEGACTVHAP